MNLFSSGNKDDYDEWAQLSGDESWSYDRMLKYFKKLENFNITRAEIDPELHNFDGPVHITNAPYRSQLARAFVKAGTEMGLPPVDYNGHSQIGFSYLQTNQINGERLSTNRAYLHPVRKRKNLFVSMNSHVHKILIDPKTKSAYGVEFTKQNKTIEVFARKEVILCAGAIGSPKLLMLSGIGPAQHLQSLNIKILKDSPVGENLMDHIAYGGLTFLVNETVGITTPDFLNPRNLAINNFFFKRKGPIATPLGVEGLAFFNVDDPKSLDKKPNMEFMFGSGTMGSDYNIHIPLGITDTDWKNFFAVTLHRHGYLIWPLLVNPKSRGKILLRSSNPLAKPKIFANYYSHPDDVRITIKGIRMAIELSKSEAMQRYRARLYNPTVPGCKNLESDSDAYWECAIRRYTMTVWHPSGTCKMGRENDASAVVNTNLQVCV